jgi:hypothetical protein
MDYDFTISKRKKSADTTYACTIIEGLQMEKRLSDIQTFVLLVKGLCIPQEGCYLINKNN